jgi:nitrate reductase assembly molybdenum cofactor insertion protein NarJ
MKDLSHYTLLAALFDYPGPGTRDSVEKPGSVVRSLLPGMYDQYEAFSKHVKNHTPAGLQEYYIATFDVQALCFLDIGYVLYGEDYQRGVFLVHMKQEQEKAGNDCGSELPDHLPNILRLLPKIKDELLSEELVFSMMIPALEKMIGSFHSEENVYKGLLRLLLAMMQHDYPESSFGRFDFHTKEKAKNFQKMRS